LKLSNFTKIYSRKIKKEVNYASLKDVLEELQILEKQKGWTIFEALKTLKEGKADSFSFTKDNPYHYFYARITEEVIILKLRTRKKEIEFRIPREQLI